MQIFNKRKVNTLEQETQKCLVSMAKMEQDSDGYKKMLETLERLMRLEHRKNSGFRVKADTLAQIGGSLAGILVIVGYEHGHVLVSKALNYVIKGRV